MNLQPASRKEIKRIAIGTAILDALMIAAFALLSLLGIMKFEPLPILLAAGIGSLLAIGSFTLLCLTVQQAVEIEDRKKMQAKFQLSYNIRMVIQAGWVVACYLIKPIHFVAGAAPILFPNVVIYYLQFTGKLMPKEEAPAQAPAEAAEEAPSGESEP